MNTKFDYLEKIKERLIEIDPYKIILFGSLANGNYKEESDIAHIPHHLIQKIDFFKGWS
jgi:predicted nucleotidyltransferase